MKKFKSVQISANQCPFELELEQKLSEMHRVVVAFSGGADSAYLLAVSVDVLGAENVLAVTVNSPLLPAAELARAEELTRELGVSHLIVDYNDLADARVAANSPERCYYCKRARFSLLQELARERGFEYVIHGENADDADDYRPGARAAQELGIRAPLAETGLTKAEIRELSRRRGLPTWDLPAQACLASRFPYHTPLTREGLERVAAAERILRDEFALRQLRVRDHYPVARLEVEEGEMARLVEAAVRARIVGKLKDLGYTYVTLDLSGYRMGSLNEQINT